MKITRQTRKEDLEQRKIDCRRCGHCCSNGSGFVCDHEIEPIAASLGIEKDRFIREKLEEVRLFNTVLHRFRLIRVGSPHGRCIFLDQKGSCAIQNTKPLHCRITACGEDGDDANEWFILNHFVDPTDSSSMREWEARLKCRDTIAGGEIVSLLPEPGIREKMLSGHRSIGCDQDE